MKKIVPLALCAVLMLLLAACRGVAEKPFADVNFVPDYASIKDQSPGHVVLEVDSGTFDEVVQFYRMSLLYVGAQQISLDDTQEGFWMYAGTYGDNNVLNITVRDSGDKIQILVAFVNEMQAP